MITVAVLIPSKGRAHQMAANVGNLLTQPLPHGVRLVVALAIEQNDQETAGAALSLKHMDWGEQVEVVLVWRVPGLSAGQAWRLAHQMAEQLHQPDWFVLGADDVTWGDDWLLVALETARKTGAQVLGLNDGHTDLQKYGPHYMAHRSFVALRLSGQFVPDVYEAWWFDREVCEVAQGLGLYAPAWEAHVLHRHPDWGTAMMDATYALGVPLRDRDKMVYLERKGKRLEIGD